MLNSQHFNVGRTLKTLLTPVLLFASVLVIVGFASLNVFMNGHAELLGLGYPRFSNPALANPAELRYFPDSYSQPYSAQVTSFPRLMYNPYNAYNEDYSPIIADQSRLASAGLQYAGSSPRASTLPYSPYDESSASTSNYPELTRMDEGISQPQPVNTKLR
jgi:hypothetical protein